VRLAHHVDEKTHVKYVMSTPEMRTIPDAVVPKLLAHVSGEWVSKRAKGT
jgi:hypothetical protein